MAMLQCETFYQVLHALCTFFLHSQYILYYLQHFSILSCFMTAVCNEFMCYNLK